MAIRCGVRRHARRWQPRIARGAYYRAYSSYTLGYDSAELARLEVQHNVWQARARELYRRARIRYGDHVADFGSGPGHSTLELAEIVGPRGSVTALDSSGESLALLRSRAEARGWTAAPPMPPQTPGVPADTAADAADTADTAGVDTLLRHPHFGAIKILPPVDAALPLEGGGGLDAVWSRWLLTWVRDPAPVIANMHAALRPGGRVAITDYFDDSVFRLEPGPGFPADSGKAPVFERLLDALMRGWKAAGDPSVAAKVPALLVSAGFEVESVAPNAPIIQAGSADWIWPTTFGARGGESGEGRAKER